MIKTARAALPQSPYKKFVLKPHHIKYYGPILAFFMMIAAIKVFLNYATIQTSIAQVRKETMTIQRRTQYASLQAYMYARPESQLFIAHDNGVLLERERIMVSMISETPQSSGWVENTGTLIVPTSSSWATISAAERTQELLPPWKSWIRYIAERMD